MNTTMNNITRTVGAFLLATILPGCVILGDGLINAAERTMQVRATTYDGRVLNRLVAPMDSVSEHAASSAPDNRYKTIDVTDTGGREIGHLDLTHLPRPRRGWYKFVKVIIFDDGVYLRPRKWRHPYSIEAVIENRREIEEYTAKLKQE